MLARTLTRRRRDERAGRRPRWFEVPEEPDEDPDYDRFGIMMKVDQFDRGWRDLVNEYGYTPVVKVMFQTADAKAAANILAQQRANRQAMAGFRSI